VRAMQTLKTHCEHEVEKTVHSKLDNLRAWRGPDEEEHRMVAWLRREEEKKTNRQSTGVDCKE